MNAFDVVVIGAGSGGLTAAVGFSKVGKRVLLIEREHLGGECTNSGCIPSKALLHHAKNFHLATTIAGATTQSNEYRQRAFTYVRETVDAILEEETPAAFEALGITVVLGEAEFTGPCVVKVANTSYTFTTAIIATGSSPRPLDVPGLDPATVLTNQNIFALDHIPERTLIIGAGPIGLEMGQALAMLGSQITIATIDSEFAKLEDPAIRPILQKAFVDLGITIELGAYITAVENGFAIFDRRDDTTTTDTFRVPFDKILVAIGRIPNIPPGCAAAGIKTSEYGITVDSQYRTTNKSVYALGDVAQRLKFTHTADDTARQVVTRVVSRGLLRVTSKKAVPKVTYTLPEVAQVGLSWSEALTTYSENQILRLEIPFTQNDRAKTDDDTSGVLVVIAKRLSGRVLGAHIIGPAAGEILTIFTLAMDQKLSLWKLRSLIYAYPTYSLIVKKAGDKFFATQIGNLKSDIKNLAKTHAPKVVFALAWIIGLYYLYHYQQSQNLSSLDLAFVIFDFIALSIWGALIYIAAYAVRPLLFIPGTLLTILSGVFFGFWYGTLLTIIAANISAVVAYGVGRFFGKDLRLENTALRGSISALRENPFETVLITRLIFLPFDVVSYAAGILKLPLVPFVVANVVGTLLGIATFVAIGASLNIETLRTDGITSGVIDLQFLLLSAIIFVVSLALSRFLKRTRNLNS